jgi:hypothetical protein
MPARKHQITGNIKRAKREIADAEADLRKLIVAIRALPRAQKVTISEALTEAFAKLTSANGRLAELEKLLKTESP